MRTNHVGQVVRGGTATRFVLEVQPRPWVSGARNCFRSPRNQYSLYRFTAQKYFFLSLGSG
jgi:hypothetical protein